MQFGFGVLRHSSSVFWAMTPRELHAAGLTIVQRAALPPARASIASLMEAFPDVI